MEGPDPPEEDCRSPVVGAIWAAIPAMAFRSLSRQLLLRGLVPHLEMSAQRNAEGEGFLLYSVANGRGRTRARTGA